MYKVNAYCDILMEFSCNIYYNEQCFTTLLIV